MRPTFCVIAPVNAPFSCRTVRSQVGRGMAAQLSFTKRALIARLRSWMRGDQFFSVPVSPSKRTVESLGRRSQPTAERASAPAAPDDPLEAHLAAEFLLEIVLLSASLSFSRAISS